MRTQMKFTETEPIYLARTFTFSVDITQAGLGEDEASQLQVLLDNARPCGNYGKPDFGPIQEKLSKALRNARIYPREFDDDDGGN